MDYCFFVTQTKFFSISAKLSTEIDPLYPDLNKVPNSDYDYRIITARGRLGDFLSVVGNYIRAFAWHTREEGRLLAISAGPLTKPVREPVSVRGDSEM